MSHNLRLALALASQGYAVFPVQNAPGDKDRHKKPCQGVLWRSQATTVASKIEAWWRLWPDAMRLTIRVKKSNKYKDIIKR
jgi:hypothetical protein